jgi:hypothetical protein
LPSITGEDVLLSNKVVEAWKSNLPNGIQVFVSAGVKEIHPIAERIVNRLIEIDRIQYIRVTPSDIQASSDISTKGRAKIPISEPSHPTAVGVHLIFEPAENRVQFHEITSAEKGYGDKIVNAVMASIPGDWNALVILDYSDGFWDRMIKKYDKIIIP